MSGSLQRQPVQKSQALWCSLNNKEAGVAGARRAKVEGSGSQGGRGRERRNKPTDTKNMQREKEETFEVSTLSGLSSMWPA